MNAPYVRESAREIADRLRNGIPPVPVFRRASPHRLALVPTEPSLDERLARIAELLREEGYPVSAATVDEARADLGAE